MHLITVILFCTTLCVAQKTWGWKDCINYAFENNIEIQNSELISRESKLNYQTSAFNFLPTLNAASSANYSLGRTIDYTNNSVVFDRNIYNGYGLYSQLGLFNSFSRINQLKFDKYNHLISTVNIEMKRNLVMFDVLNAFLSVALYRSLSMILDEKLKTAIMEYHRVDRMHELGVIAGSDVLEMNAQVAADSFLIDQNKTLVEQSYYRLMDAMNMSADSGFQIETPLLPVEFVHISNSKEEIDSAISFLPDFKRLEYQLEASEHFLAVKRAALFPSLNMNAAYQTAYFKNLADMNAPAFNRQIENNMNQYVGFSLNIPIFNGIYNYNNVRKAKIEVTIKQNDLERKLLLMENEVKKAISDLNLAKNEYLSSIKQRDARQIALEKADKTYEKGLITIIEYNLVKNRATDSEVEVLRTSLQLFLKERTLAFFINGTIL
jgi:outer membrane protein